MRAFAAAPTSTQGRDTQTESALVLRASGLPNIVTQNRSGARNAIKLYAAEMELDLFSSTRPDDALHPQFLKLRDDPKMAPAREAMRDVAAKMNDPDGNLVEQFQTHGFDSRTFEIYLNAFFDEAGHRIDRSHDRPDFLVSRGGITAAVEAVTANPKPGPEYQPYELFPNEIPQDVESVIRMLKHEVAIKFGSPLFSKLRKRYWELPHVRGLPLVIAIQNFHHGGLSLSSTALSQYLFGLDHDYRFHKHQSLVVEAQTVETHIGSKTIPSNFFGQPGAENVSAILFCNAGTVPKFGRIGHQGHHRSCEVRMVRYGSCLDHDPNSTEPELFAYEVGDSAVPPEPWRDGTVLIQNPNAIHPLPQEWIGAAAEEHLGASGTVVLTWRDPFIVYESMTMLFPGDIVDAEMWRRVDHEMKLRQYSAGVARGWR